MSSLNMQRQSEGERSSTPSLRMSTPRYDRGESGDVEFKYVIDVSDFKPEEIKVTQTGSSVSIAASTSKIIQSSEPNSSCSRSEKKEYHKTITLPTNSDLSKKLVTNYENGKLVLKVPVTTASYNSIYPLSAMNSRRGSSQNSGAQFFPAEDSRKRYTENLRLGPGFTRDSIKINVSGDVVTVTATQDEKDNHGCQSTRQYSSEHKFPTNVDLDQIQADWSNGDLIISAPFKF